MSEPVWRAALVGARFVTVWPMDIDGHAGQAEVLTNDALARLPGPVIAAGLSDASRSVPAKPGTTTTHVQNLPNVAAIPMLRQDTPAALSRGAETAIVGFLSKNSDYDGILLVLGEETCWAHISAEEVVSFQTFLTPGLARALEAQAPEPTEEFDAALDATLSRPERLAQHLASARAAGNGQEAAHLVGAEIAAAKPYWLGQQVTLLGDEHTAAGYLRALEKQGVIAALSDLQDAYLDGFRAAWAELST